MMRIDRGVVSWPAAATAMFIAALFVGLAPNALAQAGAGSEPVATRVKVRVIGHDSKVIGGGVGGALVRITRRAL